MDDNSEDEFEENFGELDDEMDHELDHELDHESAEQKNQPIEVHGWNFNQYASEKTDSGFSDSAKQSRTTTYATN